MIKLGCSSEQLEFCLRCPSSAAGQRKAPYALVCLLYGLYIRTVPRYPLGRPSNIQETYLPSLTAILTWKIRMLRK